MRWNPSTSMLYTHALERREGRLAEGGPLAVDTGRHTGRSPKDKFIVREPGSEERIWWGDVNAEISEDHFDGLREKVAAHLGGARSLRRRRVRRRRPEASDRRPRDHQLPVPRAVRADDVHRPDRGRAAQSSSRRRSCCTRPASRPIPRRTARARAPSSCCTRPAQEILIGGTFYAGEIKKSIFTLMNDRLPLEGVFPMHCSANVGEDGDVAVFFGLSGTGKTTLSADPERHLIGDDEHGWGDDGVFNFEGGCYAKVIRLSAEAEPEIYKTTRSFGTILENVVLDESGNVDLDDDSKTENTRAAYNLEQIANHLPTKRAGHPRSVVMLTADAFGILPPIARLTPRAGDVLLPLRLHGEARRHRDRRQGAAADLLGLLRRAVPAAAADGLRAPARREARRARLGGLARQHGLDRAGRTARASGCRSRRRARSCARRSPASWRTPSTGPTSSSASRSRSRCRASTRSCSTRARRGATPSAYDAKARELAAMFRDNFAKFDADDAVVAGRPARLARRAIASRAFRVASNEVDAKHDVLVIGAGCAGMRAAIEAYDAGADVAIVSKLHPTRSHSGAAEGGINAALGNASEDDPETHAYDTVKGSDYLGDQDAIEILCNEAPGDVYQLEHWGAVFSRTEDGRIAQRPFGAAGAPRTAYAADITGHVLIQMLYEQIVKRDILVYEEYFALAARSSTTTAARA